MERWKLPPHYFGATWEGYFVAPVSTNRDADNLTRSNWDVITADLDRLAKSLDLDPELYGRVEESHWACGWVAWYRIHESLAPLLARALVWQDKLEGCPVADEDHWADLEYREADEFWASSSVADRVDMIKRSGSAVSVFSARRDEVPHDDDGLLYEYLRG